MLGWNINWYAVSSSLSQFTIPCRYFLFQFPRPVPHTQSHRMAAAVNCYLSVTSTATPTSQDSPQPAITRPPTKIILPKKKPMKWSTGVAPGEYGGPPTTTKLRKYWGGDEDPLASDEYLWNKDFMGRMKKFIQDPVDVDTNSDPRFSSAKVQYLANWLFLVCHYLGFFEWFILWVLFLLLLLYEKLVKMGNF